jgi:hypothetical protein
MAIPARQLSSSSQRPAKVSQWYTHFLQYLHSNDRRSNSYMGEQAFSNHFFCNLLPDLLPVREFPFAQDQNEQPQEKKSLPRPISQTTTQAEDQSLENTTRVSEVSTIISVVSSSLTSAPRRNSTCPFVGCGDHAADAPVTDVDERVVIEDAFLAGFARVLDVAAGRQSCVCG